MAAIRKKATRDADDIEAEHGGPDISDHLFGCCLGQHRRVVDNDAGQRTLVDLVVGGSRHRRQRDHTRGHHRLGQTQLQGGDQGGFVDGGGGDVGQQVVAVDDDGAFADAFEKDRCFNFAGFDADAAQLDLLVFAREPLEFAVGPQANDVAGAIDALAGTVVTGWIALPINERRRGQRGRVEVAVGEPRPRHEQLAGLEDRHLLQVLVDDDAANVRRASTNRDAHRRGHSTARCRPRRRKHGRLGGPVLVHQARRGVFVVLVDELARELFAANDHKGERVEGFDADRGRVEDCMPQGWHRRRVGDLATTQGAPDRQRIAT